MFSLINNLRNKKGFTLIELIVVLAVLAIIMAIAVPRFLGVQDEARIKGDAATAQQIIKAARLQEARNSDGTVVVGYNKTAEAGETDWDVNIMAWPTSKNATDAGFVLSGGGDDDYVVTWTVSTGTYANKLQTLTEGVEFSIN